MAARLLRRPGLYLCWARAASTIYHGLTYSRGPFGAVADWLEQVARRTKNREATTP